MKNLFLKEESTDTYVLVEDQKGHGNDVMIVDEEEAESAMASASDQREEELQVRLDWFGSCPVQ